MGVYARIVNAAQPLPNNLPLLKPVVALTAGIVLARTDMLPVGSALLLLAAVAGLLLLLKQWAPLMMLCLGVLWGAADLLLTGRQLTVDARWLDQPALVSATVEEVTTNAGLVRLLLQDVESDSGLALSGKALLYLYGKKASSSVAAGQKVRLTARWRLPRNYLNPGAFDYRAYCFDRHIALIGSAQGGVEIVGGSVSWLEAARHRLRQAIARGNEESGVLPALLLGDRSQLGEEANAVFAATGTAHLLAISGMHVGMVAGWAFLLVWWLLTRCESWIVHVPVRATALSAGCIVAFAYATLAGWPLPAMRAGLLLLAGVLAWWLARRAVAVNTLLAALALILLFDPAAIASLSLWLSFTATAAILLFGGRQERDDAEVWSARLLRTLRILAWVSVLATLATLPLVVSAFGRLPVYSLPANLLLVPLYGLAVMPLALLGEVAALFDFGSMAAMLMAGSDWFVQLGLQLLSQIASWPAGQMWSVAPPLLASIFYYVGLCFSGLLLWRQRGWVAGGVMATALAVFLFAALHERDVEAPAWVVWDVGQGAASTLLLPGRKVIVVDAPGRDGSRFNGGTMVADGLRSIGLSHIDLLILSHAQSDHLGGAMSLIRRVNMVGEIWLPDLPAVRSDARVGAIVSLAAARNIPVRWLVAGERVSFGPLVLSVLWPLRGYRSVKANNMSLVLLAEQDGMRLLWPGDIEREVEEHLLGSVQGPIGAMLMPHHGSRSSSQGFFLQALQPSLAVAQAGFANRYGFPHAEVVKRYRLIGANVLETAQGTAWISWPSTEAPPLVRQWQPEMVGRRELIRQWMQPAGARG